MSVTMRPCRVCNGTGVVPDYGPNYPPDEYDVNRDGFVNSADLAFLRRVMYWNKPTSPPAPAERETITHGLNVYSGDVIENTIIDLTADSDAIGLFMRGPVRDLVLRNVEIIGGNTGILSTFDHSPNGNRNWVLDNVLIRDQKNKGTFFACDGLSATGLVIANTMSHALRLWAIRNAAFTGCRFGAVGSNAAALKLHNDARSGFDWSENVTFHSCLFSGKAPWIATVGTQDQYKPEKSRNITFTSSKWLGKPDGGYQIGLRVNAPNVTAQDCDAEAHDDEFYFFDVTRWGNEPEPTGCLIENCVIDDEGQLVRGEWSDTRVIIA